MAAAVVEAVTSSISPTWWDHSPVGQYDNVKDFSFRDGDKIGFYRNCDLSVGQTRDGNLLIFHDAAPLSRWQIA